MNRENLKFLPETHQYFVGDKELPSVTAILRGCGIIPNNQYYNNDFSRNVGQVVHVACDLLNRKNLDWSSLIPEVAGYVRSYERWTHIIGFEMIASEMAMYSQEWRFAGKLDVVGWVKGKRLLLDLKTGVVLPGTAIQTAGYEILWQENQKVSIQERGSLKLFPDGSLPKLTIFPNPDDIEIFKACRKIYNWRYQDDSDSDRKT